MKNNDLNKSHFSEISQADALFIEGGVAPGSNGGCIPTMPGDIITIEVIFSTNNL